MDETTPEIMSARDDIFQRIRQAVGQLPHPAAYPEYETSVAESAWLREESDLVELFQRRFVAAGGVFFSSVAECADWLGKQKVQFLHVAAGLDDVANGLQPVVPHLTRTYQRVEVDAIDASATLATAAIAESGTLILTDMDTPDRLAALAPWHHIAVLRREAIHRSIGEAIAALPADPNTIWVTGPSKTADVEGILIQGVHGPGQQACLLL